ncbi:MAG: hypothetical protein I8H75_01285 [Myxococcaceae bacterium]|nr:hypothetical protein [Myxococcaceae bacterium]MBH2005975.1 hypothetical protein [Myxococcaceae bacterium]
MSLKENRFPSTASMILPLLALAATVIGWKSQILATPTFESALYFGLFLAPASFFAGVSRGVHRASQGYMQDFRKESFWVFGSLVGVLFLLKSHTVVVQSCSTSAGMVPFLVAIVPQLLLNLSTGLWIGRLIGQMRLAMLVSVLLWVGYWAMNIVLWWYQPSLRFFEPYWLFIAGDLVRGQNLDPALLFYKLSNLLLALALIGMGVYTKFHATKFWLVLTLLGLGLFGQWQSSSWISPPYKERLLDYPDQIVRRNVILHTNLKAVGHNSAEGILQEANLWLNRLEKRTGIRSAGPIRIWLYKNSEDLARHTGAKNVHFSLPSHREIHITGTQIPHPTLGHELAHVLIGQVSNTLWRVPGIFGLIPNWGLSEGLAVYLTPELAIQESLTYEQQAMANDRLGFEKSPEDLLNPDLWSFWLNGSTRSGVASATLLDAYLTQQCSDEACVQKNIRDIAKTGEIWFSSDFLKLFHLRLKQESLPQDAIPWMKTEHRASSILFQDCRAQKVESPLSLEAKADALALSGQWALAAEAYRQIDGREQSVSIQRRLLLKQALLTGSRLGKASFQIFVEKPQDPLRIGALFGDLGYLLSSHLSPSAERDAASYLFARAQILSGNFELGLQTMPTHMTGVLGLESKRLVALGKSQMGQALEASAMFEALKQEAWRAADRIRLADLSERASLIASGQKYLLGVWESPFISPLH